MANILDLAPDAFMQAMEELNLPEADQARLREQYRQKNSTFSGIKEALAPEEGRNTGTSVPISVPEGKSIAEGVMEGDWKFAVPEGLSGGVTGFLEGVEAPGQIASGTPYSQQELEEAAWKTASAAGAGSLAFSAPKGATRMFGGMRANSPGKDRMDNPLPETAGFDNKYRFEFSDRDMVTLGRQITRAPTTFSAVRDPGTTTLADVTIHPELFSQYPHLKDQKIFVDTELDREGKYLGYYSPSTGVLAVAESVASDPEKLRRTLVHEIQHSIQDFEDFGGKGTNPESPDVEGPAKNISTERLDRIKEGEAQLKRDWEDWKKLDRGKIVERFEEAWPTIAKDYPDLDNPTDQYGKNLAYFKKEFEFFSQKDLSNPENWDVIDNFAEGLISNLSLVAQKEAEKGNFKPRESFTEVFGIEPEGFEALPYKDRREFAQDIGIGVKKPENPTIGIPRDARVVTADKYEAYYRNAGEVESRNTENRIDLTDTERFNMDPESTEDRPRSVQWYAEGGMVQGTNMDNEMTKLFAEGGLNTGDAQVDPISGNEVPPGSLPEEVRDDVDAKLSTGEYVVPADVLRFYGVAYFEKLRKRAKEGLAQMDKDGRIGGDPEEEAPEMEEEENDFPFGEEDLMFEEEGEELEMADGGLVPPGGIKTFDPSQYAPGFSIFGTPPQQNIENKTYTNAQGQQMTIQFIDGQPQQPIPAGYFPPGQAPTQTAVNGAVGNPLAPSKPDSPNRDERRGEQTNRTGTGGAGPDWAAGRDWSNMSVEDATKLASERLKGSKLVKGIGAAAGLLGAVPGLIGGAAANLRPYAEANALEKVLRAKGNIKAADAVAAMTDDQLADAKLGIRTVEPLFASGTGIAKSILAGATTTAPVTAPAVTTRATNAPAKTGGSADGRTVVKSGDATGGQGAAKGPISGSTGGNSQKKGAPPAPSRPAPSAPAKSAPAKTASKPTPSKTQGGGKPRGGRATGGLVERRKK